MSTIERNECIPCEVCLAMRRKRVKNEVGLLDRLLRRGRHGEVSEATVGLTIRPIKDHYLRDRNVRRIPLCSKHQRMLLKAMEGMIDSGGS